MKKILFIAIVLIPLLGYSQTKIYKDASIVITATQLNYTCKSPFVIDTTGKIGYTDFTSLDNLANYGSYCGNFKWLRNTLITDYVATWATLTLAERKILVRYYIYPNGTPIAELDSCYTLAERDKYREECIEFLRYCDYTITEGIEDKYYYQSVNSSGMIIVIEITTYQITN